MKNSQPTFSKKPLIHVFFRLKNLKNYTKLLVCAMICLVQQAYGQLPSLSYSGYSGPKTYTVGAAISPLTPSNGGGAIIATGVTKPFAGPPNSNYSTSGYTNGTQSVARFNGPNGIAEDASGNIYVADQNNNTIRKITPAGVVTTLAGSTTSGSANGTGTAAKFNHPTGVAVDGSGNVYVADNLNNMIRKITPAGVVTTLAGSTTSGSANGTGTAATFNAPTGLTVDGSSNVYVADNLNNMIRKITSAGVVTTFAGSTTSGSTNGTGTAARFSHPVFIAIDGSGNLYVTDRTNNMIRKISSAAVVTTLAGSTIAGSTDGTGIAASFNSPTGIAVYGSGNIFVADENNHAVRMITPGGVVSTYVSSNLVNSSGFSDPFGVAIDATGTIYVADHGANLISKITPVYYSLGLYPQLPPGLSFNTTTGVISGTPTSASPATDYTVTAYSATGAGTFTLTIAAEVLNNYDKNNFGFIQQENISTDGITTDAQINSLPLTQKQTTRSYYDGFGRPIQSLGVKASPLQNDIIRPSVYDNLGRQTISYLPYAGQSTDISGSYRDNAMTAVRSFYNNTGQNIIAQDTSPYAQQVFDNSPLQRMLLAGTVGVGYQPVSGQHYSTVSYRYNSSTDGNIVIVNPDGTVTTGNYYPTSSLMVTDGVDAGGAETLTFTDKAGHIVLKRQILSGTNVDTYYIYNTAGMLSYIVPPAALAVMAANSSYSLTQTGVNKLIFKYTYDQMGRLIEKTVPGKETMYIVYDPLNRPVLMQDANMNAQNEWNYIRYDVKNRPISQGTYVDNTNLGRANMQTYVNGLASTYATTWYESRSTGVSRGYYTANVFPTATTGTLTPYAFAYYDNYDFTDAGSDYFQYTAQGLTNEESATTASLRGAPTMVRSRVVGSGIPGTTWLLKVTFYDKRGNPIQVRSNNQIYYTLDVLTDYQTTVPNFVGVPQVSQVSKQTALTTFTTVLTSFSYDHMFRITGVSQQYNGAGTLTPVASYSYNELGQVIQKGLGYVSSSTWLQNVDMRYGIRGQLLSINNSKLSNDGGVTNNDSNDLFGMQFMYDQTDSNLGNTAYYDGKLSAVKWMSKDGSGNPSYERAYKYNYDQLDRYTSANYAERNGAGLFNNNIGGFDETIGYYTDNSGNIATLTRNSSTQGTNSHVQIDNLAYTYDPANPNQLHTVTDGTGSNYTGAGFQNLTGTTTGTYAYDTNGNLVTDPYKGLSIGYDFLNRTDKITVTTATHRWVDYTYDNNGNLLRKRQYDNNVLQNTTDYVGGFVYINSALSYFPMPEGRVLNVSGTLTQEFIITDQQGNARLSFQNNGSGTAVVKQENSYYATGLIMPNSPVSTPTTPNKQLYNGGSEWQNDYSNQPDYYQTFNRNYDAAIARFIAVDPVAESAESMTTYQYAGNNPVMNNDPMGSKIEGGGWSSNGHVYDSDGREIKPAAINLLPYTSGGLLPAAGPHQAGWIAEGELAGTISGLYGIDPMAAWNNGLASGTSVYHLSYVDVGRNYYFDNGVYLSDATGTNGTHYNSYINFIPQTVDKDNLDVEEQLSEGDGQAMLKAKGIDLEESTWGEVEEWGEKVLNIAENIISAGQTAPLINKDSKALGAVAKGAEFFDKIGGRYIPFLDAAIASDKFYRREISAGMYGYSLTGTGASAYTEMEVGAEFGGAYGALAGLGVGLAFKAGSAAYDFAKPGWDQFTQAVGQINYNLNNSRGNPW